MKTKPDRSKDGPTGKSVIPAALRLGQILVPIDFSDCSEKALAYALPFARQFHAHLILLHVLPVHYNRGWEFDAMGYEPLIEGNLRRETEARLNRVARKPLSGRIPTRVEVRHGAPAIEIVDAAKEMDVDLIIMSTHGHTGRVHAFIGSVAGDVTRLAPCPVLVVREHEHDFVPSGPNPFKANQPLPTAPAQ